MAIKFVDNSLSRARQLLPSNLAFYLAKLAILLVTTCAIFLSNLTKVGNSREKTFL